MLITSLSKFFRAAVFRNKSFMSTIPLNPSDKATAKTAAESNHPNSWQPGQTQVSPYDLCDHRSIDVVPGGSYYHLLISSVVPRPVAFLSTQSASGINNLAPFSYFSAVCHDPPTISVGICTTRYYFLYEH